MITTNDEARARCCFEVKVGKVFQICAENIFNKTFIELLIHLPGNKFHFDKSRFKAIILPFMFSIKGNFSS